MAEIIVLKKRRQCTFWLYSWSTLLEKLLFPSSLRLWQAKRNGSSFQIVTENEAAQKFAFIGVRSCDIHAISIQDKVFMGGQYIDPYYKLRREDAFVIAVNCGKAGGTCFCVSMNTGPQGNLRF